MTDWYRNAEWTEDIAAEFEARLARSRSQKAQYLLLQGQALIAGHPRVAEGLLARAVDMGEEFHTARALGYLAQARLVQDDVDGAIAAYEQALEAQLAQPNLIAVQPSDYLFLVGYFGRVDRLPFALPIAEALPDEVIFGPDPQTLAAKAMVFALAGHRDQAAALAGAALPLFATVGDAEALGISVAELRKRLEAIAEGRA